MSCMFMMNDPWYSHTHPLLSLPYLSSFPTSPSMCLLPHSFCFVLWAAEFSPGHLCDMDFRISTGDSGCPSPSTNIRNFSLQGFDPRVSPSLIHGRLVMGPVLSRPGAIAAHRVYKLEMAFASPSPHSLALKSFLPLLLQCPLGLKGDGRNVLVRAKSSIVTCPLHLELSPRVPHKQKLLDFLSISQCLDWKKKSPTASLQISTWSPSLVLWGHFEMCRLRSIWLIQEAPSLE